MKQLVLNKISLYISILMVMIADVRVLASENISIKEGSSHEITVHAEVGSSFNVTIPKIINLVSEENGTGLYEAKLPIKVTGDIGKDQLLHVDTEVDIVELTSNNNDKSNATVEKGETTFTFEQLTGGVEIETKHKLSANLIPGEWKGTIKFNISLEKKPTYYATFSNAIDNENGTPEQVESSTLILKKSSNQTSISLVNNSTLGENILINNNTSLNLEQYNLESNGNILEVQNSNLSISGGENNSVLNTGIYITDNSTVNINGGRYTSSNSIAYVDDGNLNITDGTFEVSNNISKFSIRSGLADIIDYNIDSYNQGNVKINITGGTFINWNPSQLEDENGNTRSLIADGYVVLTERLNDNNFKYTVVNKNSHTHNLVETIKESTCTSKGLKLVRCSSCGEVTEEIELPLKSHKQKEKIIDSTCTKEGTKIIYCENCNLELETIKIDKKQHELEYIEKSSTCEINGYIIEKCKICGEELSNTIIDKKNHNIEIIRIEPTCKEVGYIIEKCIDCEAEVSKTEVEALGHIEEVGEEVKPTCEIPGKTAEITCKTCGVILTESVEIEATGHTEEVIKGTEATCTKDKLIDGLTDGKKCSTCNKILVEQKIIKAEHKLENIVGKKPSCTETGLTDGKKCTVCESIIVEQKVIEPTGHTEETIKGYSPTHKDSGLTDGIKCKTCGLILVEQETIEPTGFTVWDGKSTSEPSIDGEWLIIETANELAWVSKNGTKGKEKIKVTYDINMGGYEINSIQSKIIELHGSEKTISNAKINGSGLFENLENVIVNYITVENFIVTGENETGILVGKINNSAKFEKVEIKDSKALSKNSSSTGSFLGILVGDTLENKIEIFNCNVSNVDINGNPLYKMSNNSEWLGNIDNKWDNVIGTQKSHRGKIYIDNSEFKARWDGKTTVEPKLENKVYIISTPFDLAGLRAKSGDISSVKLIDNLDMYGYGVDGKYNIDSKFSSKYVSKDDNNFTPFNKIQTLDGQGYAIYNLKIDQTEKEIGAFILRASGTTVHKNIKFNNGCVVATHNTADGNATAYGGMLIASAGGSNYTATGVEITDCEIYALQKIGCLIGYLGATNSKIDNCKVSGSKIENYQCNISERFDSGNKTFEGRTVRVYADFYPQGEVGGLIGFVTKNAKISNCSVTSCKIKATGQNDKMATVTGSRLGRLAIALAGYYKVPGRHVGSLIGDIRAGGTITIDNCKTSSMSLSTRWDKHNSVVGKDIGQAYYVKFMDSMGSVKVNGSKLTLADCNKNTTR